MDHVCLCNARFRDHTWQQVLSVTIDSYLREGNAFPLTHNPLKTVNDYYDLSEDNKVELLRMLCDWQLQDASKVRALIDDRYREYSKNPDTNPLLTRCLGTSAQKHLYWHFGGKSAEWDEQYNIAYSL
jgi:hypothetical protein